MKTLKDRIKIPLERSKKSKTKVKVISVCLKHETYEKMKILRDLKILDSLSYFLNACCENLWEGKNENIKR